MSGSRSTSLPSSTMAFMLQWPAHRWQKVKISVLVFVPGGEAVPACRARLAPSSGWMKASITGLNLDSPAVSFSMVTMSLPSASAANTRQELTSLPSIATVHAPHSPMLHPSLVFASLKSSTSTSRSVRHGSTANSRCSPFTVNRTLNFALASTLAFIPAPSSCPGAGDHAFQPLADEHLHEFPSVRRIAAKIVDRERFVGGHPGDFFQQFSFDSFSAETFPPDGLLGLSRPRRNRPHRSERDPDVPADITVENNEHRGTGDGDVHLAQAVLEVNSLCAGRRVRHMHFGKLFVLQQRRLPRRDKELFQRNHTFPAAPPAP